MAKVVPFKQKLLLGTLLPVVVYAIGIIVLCEKDILLAVTLPQDRLPLLGHIVSMLIPFAVMQLILVGLLSANDPEIRFGKYLFATVLSFVFSFLVLFMRCAAEMRTLVH